MSKKNGTLIVFDAIDGAGKSTQLKLLARYLRKQGKKVHITDFPQYERSFFGKMVRRYLNGEFGRADQTDPYLISLLYALDRFEARERLRKYLQHGYIVLADRYSPANKIHQASKIKNPRKKAAFLHWLDTMEFKVLGIPKPNLVLFLDVPPHITAKLVKARGKRDMHETDLSHQKAAYRESLDCVKRFSHWKKVSCMNHGKLGTPMDIHNKVIAKINKYI